MSQRAFLVAVLLAFATTTASLEASDSGYVVVSLVEKGDSYEKAGAKLVDLRNAKGIRASIKELDSLGKRSVKCMYDSMGTRRIHWNRACPPTRDGQTENSK